MANVRKKQVGQEQPERDGSVKRSHSVERTESGDIVIGQPVGTVESASKPDRTAQAASSPRQQTESSPETQRAETTAPESLGQDAADPEPPEQILSHQEAPSFRQGSSFTFKRNNFDGGPNAISEILASHRKYFDSHTTRPSSWRGRALSRFNMLIQKYEEPLIEALHRDLGISRYEAYLTELAPVYEEFKTVRNDFGKWTDPRKMSPITKVFPTRYSTSWHPLGCSCIINSWQSPVTGAIVPMIDALAAGCTIVVKNSIRTKRCNEVLAVAIDELFKHECVRFIFGDEELDRILASAGFDKIFYTGRRESAVAIMQGAALNLTSPTLMLDGNCPCFVDKTAKIEQAAQRIMWGKLLHAGQMRLSPSWAIVHESVINSFVNRTFEFVRNTYGENPIEHPDYPRMFSKAEYDEACALLDKLGSRTEVVYGGERDPKTLKIAPTVIMANSIQHSIFRKRIIGPILPVVAFDLTEPAFAEIGRFSTPPAFYLFSTNKSMIRYAQQNVKASGGCLNDTVMQVYNRKGSTAALGSAGMGYRGSRFGVMQFGARRTYAESGGLVRKFRFAPFSDLKKIQHMFKSDKKKQEKEKKEKDGK